jgi:hypothetical protein
VTPTFAAVKASFVVTPGSVATITTNNGQIELAIPSNFWPTPVGGGPEDVSLTINQVSTTSKVGAAIPMFVVELDLSVNGTPTAGQLFSAPLTITESYDPIQVSMAGLNPVNLNIYLQNPTDGTITALPSTVILSNHTITATIPHLTQVALAAPNAVLFVPIGFDAATLPGW